MRWTVSRRFAISILLLLAACTLPVYARSRPHYGGTLRVEISGDAWRGADAIARRLVFDGLTELDASGAVQPALAIGWQSSDDGHHWQFRMREGVRFQDGSQLTADAVAQSLSLACTSNCPWTSVRVVGPAVVFTCDSPLPNLPDLLASDVFLIAAQRSPSTQVNNQSIGTGPFRVAQAAGNVLTLVANETSWQGRPFADQIIITSHRAIRDQWLDLTLGRADIVEVPAEQLRQAQQQRLSLVVSGPADVVALQLSDSGTLANPNLRSAIAYAVDRSAIFNVIFQKQGDVTASLIPNSVSGYAFLFPTERNLNKASQARGGLAAGTVTLSTDGDTVMQVTAQRLALNLREAGFNIKTAAPGSTAYSDIVLRKLPIVGLDAAGVLGRTLLVAGQPPAISAHNLQDIFEVEQDILSRHLIIPLVDLPRAYAVSGRVRNLTLTGYGIPDFAGISVESTP
jgi:peptide/nickel transport system substrate-binding protein